MSQNRLLPAAAVLAQEAAEDQQGSGSFDVTIEVQTCSIQYSGTETGASISFQIGEQWTQPVQLVKMVPNSGLVNQAVRLSGWPSEIRLKALGDDAWCVENIQLTTGGYNVTVLRKTEGDFQKRTGSIHWIDIAKESDADYVVPLLPEGFQPTRSADGMAYGVAADGHSGSDYASRGAIVNCTTRFDERVQAMGYTTSPAGTPCVFGQDSRDEGSHCVFDDGEYGSLGWCYTDTTRDSWGACGESCPLWGQEKILAKKIDQVLHNLKTDHQTIADKLDEALATPQPTVETPAPTSATTMTTTAKTVHLQPAATPEPPAAVQPPAATPEPPAATPEPPAATPEPSEAGGR